MYCRRPVLYYNSCRCRRRRRRTRMTKGQRSVIFFRRRLRLAGRQAVAYAHTRAAAVRTNAHGYARTLARNNDVRARGTHPKRTISLARLNLRLFPYVRNDQHDYLYQYLYI